MKSLHFLLLILSLNLLYMNCDKASFSISKSKDNAIVGPSNSPIPTALQDQIFTLTIDATPSGNDRYNFSPALPSWISLNSSTGTLTGIPTLLSDPIKMDVSKTNPNGISTSLGTLEIKVFGNPLKEYQWHLNNTGQKAFAFEGGTPGKDIHTSSALQAGYTGKGIKIAISDSGVMLQHESLVDNALPNESRNYRVSNKPNGWLESPSKDWSGDPTPPESDTSEPNNAHGTAVAGLASATGWNQLGGRGVAPYSHFAGFLYIQAQDELVDNNLHKVAETDQFNGTFDIFNFSWGYSQAWLNAENSSKSTLEKITWGIQNQRTKENSKLGSIYVMAGGNSYVEEANGCSSSSDSQCVEHYVLGNINFTELQTHPGLINVAALDPKGCSASYSTPGANLWVSAPGGGMGSDEEDTDYPSHSMAALITTDFYGCNRGIKSLATRKSAFNEGKVDFNKDCKYTSGMNATSGATPIVSGAIALILEANPHLTWRDVKYILAKTADLSDSSCYGNQGSDHPGDINGENSGSSFQFTNKKYTEGWMTNGAGFHFHNWYGFGSLNVDKAVLLAKTYNFPLGNLITTGSMTDSSQWPLVQTFSSPILIPDFNATGVDRSISVTQNLALEAVQIALKLRALPNSTSHSCPKSNGQLGDIGIELTSPKGTKSQIWNINSFLLDTTIEDQIMLTNAFYGENSQGIWTLKVLDGHQGCHVEWSNWKLNFIGH